MIILARILEYLLPIFWPLLLRRKKLIKLLNSADTVFDEWNELFGDKYLSKTELRKIFNDMKKLINDSKELM